MHTADVVIVGAGVIGASVAYHLALQGCGSVRIVERHGRPGQGSTRRATGGFRAQFGSAINVRLSLLSREKLLRFPEELGAEPGLRPCGYLFLAQRPGTLAALDAAREVQQRAGFRETRLVTPEEIALLNPAVRLEGICGGAFSPGDGFLRPLEVLRGYERAARRLGVSFHYGQPCIALHRVGDRITAVETAAGTISTGSVVNAAGAWAGLVGRLAAVDIPITPLRRQVAITEPLEALPEDMPMTIFAEDGFHLRVRDGRVLLLRPDVPRTTDPFDITVDPAWVEGVVAQARERIPSLVDARVRVEECWAGLYEMSPDGHALLGVATGVDNLYLANGSSGHGVMHAPALGQLLAEIVLEGRARTMDVHPLRPGRFAEGEPNAASVLL